nr:hypothetical protein [uncultured organism]
MPACLYLSILISSLLWTGVSFAEEKLTLAERAAITKSGELGFYKIAYVAAVRRNAIREIRGSEEIAIFPNRREVYVQRKVDEAKALVNGASFKGGWLESMANAGVDAASAVGGPQVALISQALKQKAIDNFLDKIERQGSTPQMGADETFMFGSQVFEAAKDKNNPDHKFAVEVLKDYLDLDPSVRYDMMPDVRSQIKDERMLESLNRIEGWQKDKTLSPDQVKTLIGEEMEAQGTRMAGEVAAQLQIPRDEKTGLPLTQEQIALKRKVEKYEFRMAEVSNGFGALTGIATLIGDPKAAAKFQKAQALSQGVSEAITMSLTKNLTENPMMYANIYVGVAVLAMDLISASKEQDQMAAMMDQLLKIAEQIQEMREEMHARFDLLDFKVQRQFEHLSIDVKNIGTSLIAARKELAASTAELRRSQDQILSGLSFGWKVQTTSAESKCLGIQANGTPVAILENQLLECRNFFALSATAPAALTVGAKGTGDQDFANLGKISLGDIDALDQALSESDPAGSKGSEWLTLQNWIYAAQKFSDLFGIHPEYLSYANHSGLSGRNDLSLDELVKNGESISDGMEQLLLQPHDGGYELKKERLVSVLHSYEEEAFGAIEFGKQMQKNVSSFGPLSATGPGGKAPVDDEYLFLKEHKTIGMCPGVELKIELGEYRNVWTDEVLKGILQHWNFVSEYVTDLTPKALIHYEWNNSFVPLIPNHVLWAVRSNYHNTKVIPCFRSVRVPIFAADEDGLRYQMVINLEFQVTTDMPGARNFTVGKSQYDTGLEFMKGFRYVYDKQPLPLFPVIWRGNNEGGYAHVIRKEGIMGKGAKYFKPVDAQESDPAYQAFKKTYEDEIAVNHREGRKNLEALLANKYPVSTHRVLQLIASLGLKPSGEQQQDFMNWLADEDALPSPKGLVRAAYETDMTALQIQELIEERVEVGNALIEKLATAKDLRPRNEEVKDVLAQLEILRKGQPGFFERIWDKVSRP